MPAIQCAFILTFVSGAGAQYAPVRATQPAYRFTFSGLHREVYPWYVQPAGPLAEVAVCTECNRSGRPIGVSQVFPSGTRRVGLYLRAGDGARKGRVQATFWQNDNEIRQGGFAAPGKTYHVWWATPKGSKTFLPGLYTFELVQHGELLASLDFVVITAAEVDPEALQPPEYTDVPPPARSLTPGPLPVGKRAQADLPTVTVRVTQARPQTPSPPTRVTSAAPPPSAGTATASDGGNGTRGAVVDDLIESARARSTERPERPVASSGGGGDKLLGNVLGSAGPIGSAVKAVSGLFGGGSDKPAGFVVRRTQASETWAERIIRAHGLDDVLRACGSRRPITHAVAAASDPKGFDRGVLLLPLQPLPDETALMGLVVIDDVSVALNDAPIDGERCFQFQFGGDRLYAVPIAIDQASESVKVLGQRCETLIAGPAQMATPEAQAREPFAAIHQVISLDDTGDRAVAICSLTPGLSAADQRAAVFPLLLSKERK